MKWTPAGTGEPYTGSLHFEKGEFDCSLRFYSSKDFQRFVENIGPRGVPVYFNVRYSSNGTPLSATLVQVFAWETSKFQPNERVLATSYRLRLAGPGDQQAIAFEGMSACFDPLPGGSNWAHISIATRAALLLSLFNLLVLVCGFAYRGNGSRTGAPEALSASRSDGAVCLWLATLSQVLYLLMGIVWLYRWMRFYPGRPAVLAAILIGLTLSAGAFVASLRRPGVRECAGIFVSLATAFLWVLAAVASIAV